VLEAVAEHFISVDIDEKYLVARTGGNAPSNIV